MMSLLRRLVAALALALGLGLPVATVGLSSGDTTSYEPTTIRNYEATFDVASNW
ncbi:MAG: hypothetical protein R2761_31575 [Acidimicrobiales bacterium]